MAEFIKQSRRVHLMKKWNAPESWAEIEGSILALLLLSKSSTPPSVIC